MVFSNQGVRKQEFPLRSMFFTNPGLNLPLLVPQLQTCLTCILPRADRDEKRTATLRFRRTPSGPKCCNKLNTRSWCNGATVSTFSAAAHFWHPCGSETRRVEFASEAGKEIRGPRFDAQGRTSWLRSSRGLSYCAVGSQTFHRETDSFTKHYSTIG